MNRNTTFLISELIILFVLLPVTLVLDAPIILKVLSVLLGVIYSIIITVKQKLIRWPALYGLNYEKYWKPVIIRFLLMLIGSTILMYLFNADNLFIVVRKNITMWVVFTMIYSIFSVYPQEFLYRSFFFNRYGTLFKSPYILIVVNAIIFSFAHIVFKDILVSIVTLIGGFIFALTYYKSKSLLLTSIEHALYGSWLFTLGMGEMLAFPVPS